MTVVRLADAAEFNGCWRESNPIKKKRKLAHRLFYFKIVMAAKGDAWYRFELAVESYRGWG